MLYVTYISLLSEGIKAIQLQYQLIVWRMSFVDHEIDTHVAIELNLK